MPASETPRFTGDLRECRLASCKVVFKVPLSAKNKEFCCASHRIEFHTEERKRGLELLRNGQEGAKGDG